MARLDHIIKDIVDVFLEYSGQDGKKARLNKEVLRTMFDTELSPELKEAIEGDDFTEFMGKLDKNDDGEVNFHEFSRFVAILAKTYFNKKTGRGDKKGKNKEQEAKPETANA